MNKETAKSPMYRAILNDVADAFSFKEELPLITGEYQLHRFIDNIDSPTINRRILTDIFDKYQYIPNPFTFLLYKYNLKYMLYFLKYYYKSEEVTADSIKRIFSAVTGDNEQHYEKYRNIDIGLISEALEFYGKPLHIGTRVLYNFMDDRNKLQFILDLSRNGKIVISRDLCKIDSRGTLFEILRPYEAFIEYNLSIDTFSSMISAIDMKNDEYLSCYGFIKEIKDRKKIFWKEFTEEEQIYLKMKYL